MGLALVVVLCELAGRGEREVAGVAEDLGLADVQELLTAGADDVLGRQVVARGLAAEVAGVVHELRGRDRGAAAQRDEQSDEALGRARGTDNDETS